MDLTTQKGARETYIHTYINDECKSGYTYEIHGHHSYWEENGNWKKSLKISVLI